MRTFLISFLIGLLSLSFIVDEAFAKRFGGGRSFGVQRSYHSLYSPKPQQNTVRPNSNSRWKGMLGGMLVGGLLASLFMGHGLGVGLMTWLVLGMVLFFIINVLRRFMLPGYASPHSTFGAKPDTTSHHSYFNQQDSRTSHVGSRGVNPCVDDNFLREAKVMFIRLQTAYDQKNSYDLQNFTAPEVFAEIKIQLDERGDEPNHTEVIQLNAELLDASEQVDSTIASVRFTGSLKENDEPVTTLDEIWHFRKFYNTNNWVVGGIQQQGMPAFFH